MPTMTQLRQRASGVPPAGLEEGQLVERRKKLRRHELSSAQVRQVVESVTVAQLSH
jgi:hypothetical protein